MIRAALAVAVTVALAGCATTPAAQHCLPLRPWTAAERARLDGEIAGVAAGSALAEAIIDYRRMRKADQACLAGG